LLRINKKKIQEEVNIPITPMLDMAFQLLTFFVMTYKPSATEIQYGMNFMPAAPATDFRAKAEATPKEANENIPASLRTLPTILHADAGGTLGRVLLGENEIQGMDALKRELEVILKDPSLPFDQALIKFDPDLKYEELMKVINVFHSLKVTKVSFAQLTAADG
jgi:biopolymer transport protein ExbD